MIELVLYVLIQLHSPGGRTIDLNPNEIVSLREPQSGEHFASGTRCVVNTSDGKFTTVVEDCAAIEKMMDGVKK